MSDRRLQPRTVSRRDVLGMGVGALAAAALGPFAQAAPARIGKFKQAAAFWAFKRKMPVEKLCVEAKKMGLAGFDMVPPKFWPALKKHGLICTMVSTHGLRDGLCDPKFHEKALAKIRQNIDLTAAEGWPNVITFSGNRRGIDNLELDLRPPPQYLAISY